MTDDSLSPIHVPTRDELHDVVIETPNDANPVRSLEIAEPRIERMDTDRPKLCLSNRADTFLRLVANAPSPVQPLENHWRALGVKGGSTKKRVLDELTGHGLIHLKKNGRTKVVELYPEAWKHLGIDPPKGEGRGGAPHRCIVKSIAKQFARYGCTVHIEKEIGIERKRIDLLALGKRKIGIEVGLSSVEQEVANIRNAIAAGVLDDIVLVGRDETFVNKVRQRCQRDSLLDLDLVRLHFYRVPEEDK